MQVHNIKVDGTPGEIPKSQAKIKETVAVGIFDIIMHCLDNVFEILNR